MDPLIAERTVRVYDPRGLRVRIVAGQKVPGHLHAAYLAETDGDALPAPQAHAAEPGPVTQMAMAGPAADVAESGPERDAAARPERRPRSRQRARR